MDTFAEVVKEFLLPGSSWFLILATSCVVALLYGRSRRQAVGRALLAGLVIMYWAFSVPPIARGLQLLRLPRPSRHRQTPSFDPAAPIVVLGNGTDAYVGEGAVIDIPLPQTGYNAVTAIERYHRFPGSMIIVSGGPGREGATPEAVVIRDALLKNGVPDDHILLEPASTTTQQQAVEVSRMLKARGIRATLVVTSAEHMTRAVDLFRREGIEAIPLAAASQLFSHLWAPSGNGGWWLWMLPSSEARAVSRDVMYELFAWVYYRARGWLD